MAKVVSVVVRGPDHGRRDTRPERGEILECLLSGRLIRDGYVIVQGGGLAGTDAASYTSRRSVP
jgi:hypothetical protein